MQLSFLLSAVVSALLILALAPLARRVGLVDHPGARKRHHGAVPLVGGLAIVPAFLAGLWLSGVPSGDWMVLAGGGITMALLGAWDDHALLPAGRRMLAQGAVVLAVIALQGPVLSDFGRLLHPDQVLHLGLLSVPVTVFCVVGCINAANFVDGVDGLSGLLFLVALAGLLFVSVVSGADATATVLLCAAGALLGFLLFNAPLPWRGPARVFLGDSGTLFFGFFLACQFIALSQGDDRLITPVTALWLFAVPLFDTVSSMIRRKLRGDSAMSSDREHLHHLLLAAGCSPGATTTILFSAALLCAAIGLVGWALQVSEWLLFLVFITGCFAVLLVLIRAWKSSGWLEETPSNTENSCISIRLPKE